MLRRATALLFVLLYLVAMLKPIAPFVEYAINYDYISKVLCINKDKPEMRCKGTCQLMQKLQQQEDEDYNALRIHMEEYPIGFVKLLSINCISTTDVVILAHPDYQNTYTFLYSFTAFHPPLA